MARLLQIADERELRRKVQLVVQVELLRRKQMAKREALPPEVALEILRGAQLGLSPATPEVPPRVVAAKAALIVQRRLQPTKPEALLSALGQEIVHRARPRLQLAKRKVLP